MTNDDLPIMAEQIRDVILNYAETLIDVRERESVAKHLIRIEVKKYEITATIRTFNINMTVKLPADFSNTFLIFATSLETFYRESMRYKNVTVKFDNLFMGHSQIVLELMVRCEE